jgi:anti-sigma factor RsiW
VTLAAIASGGTTFWLMRPPEDEPVAEEVVASHIRSLMPGHLIDIASSDQHTVKPWFDGRVDLAPSVADFSEQGFPLVGGRLDYIGRQPVAAIVYNRRKHFINVFACPSGGSTDALSAPKSWTIRGYNLLAWGAGDINYWMVSDAAVGDLEALRQLIATGAGGTRS